MLDGGQRPHQLTALGMAERRVRCLANQNVAMQGDVPALVVH